MSGIDNAEAVNRLTERLAYLDRYERSARAMGHIDRADVLVEDIAMFRRAIDALARDAQVAREVGTPDDRMWMSPGECAESFHDIADLYPSPGDRDDSEEQR